MNFFLKVELYRIIKCLLLLHFSSHQSNQIFVKITYFVGFNEVSEREAEVIVYGTKHRKAHKVKPFLCAICNKSKL